MTYYSKTTMRLLTIAAYLIFPAYLFILMGFALLDMFFELYEIV